MWDIVVRSGHWLVNYIIWNPFLIDEFSRIQFLGQIFARSLLPKALTWAIRSMKWDHNHSRWAFTFTLAIVHLRIIPYHYSPILLSGSETQTEITTEGRCWKCLTVQTL